MANARTDLMQGTLELMILKTLSRDSMHGYGIAQRLKLLSNDVLQVGESSLYPALQRLLLNGFVDAESGDEGGETLPALRCVERAGCFLAFQHRLAGARGRILDRRWSIPKCHDGVANVFVDRALGRLDGIGHRL